MSVKKKYYVVWKGRETGVFGTWKECEGLVKGFDSASFKSFESEQEALQAFAAGAPKPASRRRAQTKMAGAGRPITASISVDAACSGNPGIMEYQGVDTSSKKRLFYGGPFPEGTNNIGEFLAIVHGLGYLKKYGLSLPVYSDSKTAIAWVRNKKANTRMAPSARNSELLGLISRAEEWLRLNTCDNPILKWETTEWGEIPADFGRK